jgi:ribosomal protein L11
MEPIMLTEEQKRRYEETLGLAREELEHLDRELVTEVAHAKQRLHDLQEAKKAVKQIYDGACARLGVPSDLKTQNIDLADIDKRA